MKGDRHSVKKRYIYCVVYWACHWRSISGGGRGSKGVSAPGGTEEGAAFGGAKIWNSKIWPLLENCHLQCKQWYFTPLIFRNTPPVLVSHPNCQCFTTPQNAVCTPRNLHCWPDWWFTCL